MCYLSPQAHTLSNFKWTEQFCICGLLGIQGLGKGGPGERRGPTCRLYDVLCWSHPHGASSIRIIRVLQVRSVHYCPYNMGTFCIFGLFTFSFKYIFVCFLCLPLLMGTILFEDRSPWDYGSVRRALGSDNALLPSLLPFRSSVTREESLWHPLPWALGSSNCFMLI